MARSSVLIAIAGVLTLAVVLSAPQLIASASQGDDSPTDPRLVVFELFNRSESGG